MKTGEGNYSEHSPKMLVFRERLVVMHCNDAMVNNTLSAQRFLEDLRYDTKDEELTPESLADLIIERWNLIGEKRHNNFIVSGYEGVTPCVLKLKPWEAGKEKKWVFLKSNPFGATADGDLKEIGDTGKNNVVSLLQTVEDGRGFKNVSSKDAVMLVQNLLECMISFSKFWKVQSIGGDIDVYIMYRDQMVKSGFVMTGQNAPLLPDFRI